MRAVGKGWSRPLSSVNARDVEHLSSLLSSPSSIISTLAKSSPVTNSDLDSYNTDWMGKYKGSATTVVRPRSTQEVSKVLKYCSEKKIPVVPQGGNTGLVGGSIPLRDELVINLGNMASVRSFDPISGKSIALTSRASPIRRSTRYTCCRCWVYPGVAIRVCWPSRLRDAFRSRCQGEVGCVRRYAKRR